jgi:hypothetical protein
MKGVLGFVGCAGVCGAAYAIGKHVGREEALKDVEIEERRMAAQKPQKILVPKEITPVEEPKPEVQNEPEEKSVTVIEEQPVVTAAENVRKKHGINILAVKENGKMNFSITADCVLKETNTLYVLGESKALHKCFKV